MRGKTYIVAHRRRREGKTDYKQRLRLLKSGKPRFVVRKSINNVTCQIVEYSKDGDKTIVSVNSNDVKKLGWKGNPGNLPAAYLVGLLCGSRANKKKIKDAVLDSGLYASTPGSRIYSALKGAVDSGLKISHSEEILPKNERIKGEHIATLAKKIKSEKPDEYKKRFSIYLKNKVSPENLPKHFDEVKKKILKK
ncbi:MAG: 50S ribosomal protein L18 [Candidatus Aenigmatarchaeota archaeon]|nr:MAG: 50S ribosomal protein L18 [Candidatus Aenigmarchaeota archaeon]